jgi:predicted nucleic acid-binding protein
LILADSDVLIEIFDKDSKKGEAALKRIEEAGEDIALTSLNLHEILYGLYKYTDNSKIEKILTLDIVDFTKDDSILSANFEDFKDLKLF